MLEISNIGLLTAFAAGAISFLSPCVLPLVPGYLSYVAGRAAAESPGGGALALRLPAVGLSVCLIPGGKPMSAYALGLAFAFGWTPCIGPILGAILTVSAASATVSGGVALLGVYSLGLGVPFLLAALFTDGLIARLKAFGRIGRALQLLAGGILILMGIAMLTGQLSAFSYWLLDAFPALAKIG